MKLTASQLRYMMALRKLDHGDKIRCTDLAKELCVKKPSVCGMLCRMENMGLITQDPYADVRITEEGRTAMEEWGRRLDCLAGLLAGRLGLSRRAAGEMALTLLGNMEQKSLEEALREFSTEYF